MRELVWSELSPFPDITRRIYQQVPAILATYQSGSLFGQRQVSAMAAKEYSSQTYSTS